MQQVEKFSMKTIMIDWPDYNQSLSFINST